MENLFLQMQLLADFGIVVLIWMVQLVVYPSFQYVDSRKFRSWHARYRSLIAMIVVPLMLGRAALHVTTILSDPKRGAFVSGTLILVAWLVTFGVSFPCHRALSNEGKIDRLLHRLITTNWIRTTCWTAVFVTSLAGLP